MGLEVGEEVPGLSRGLELRLVDEDAGAAARQGMALANREVRLPLAGLDGVGALVKTGRERRAPARSEGDVRIPFPVAAADVEDVELRGTRESRAPRRARSLTSPMILRRPAASQAAASPWRQRNRFSSTGQISPTCSRSSGGAAGAAAACSPGRKRARRPEPGDGSALKRTRPPRPPGGCRRSRRPRRRCRGAGPSRPSCRRRRREGRSRQVPGRTDAPCRPGAGGRLSRPPRRSRRRCRPRERTDRRAAA